jgi:hypothetical protein
MGVTLFREESPEGFGAFDRGLSRSERERREIGAERHWEMERQIDTERHTDRKRHD